MILHDMIALDGLRRTSDGYLVADAKVARTGIQTYTGDECGKPEMAHVRVYRPEAEVFNKDTIKSFAYRPVTVDHPSEPVTSKNWKEHAVGQTGADVVRDGEFVRVPLVLMDAAAIKAVEDGKRQLSMGYVTELVFEDGVSPDGEPYDAIQKSMRMNHLAVVAAARGGSSLRLGDNTRKEKTMTLKTVTVDGIPIEVTDQGATVIATLQQRLSDANAAKDKIVADHATAIAAKDKELAAKDAEIAKKDAALDAEKAKVLSDADLDKKVAARAALVTVAQTIAKDVNTDGLSDAAIRKAVVTAVLGDAAVKDKADAYIDARFEILAEDAEKSADPIRNVIKGGLKTTDRAGVEQAHGAMVNGLQDAWKAPTKGAA